MPAVSVLAVPVLAVLHAGRVKRMNVRTMSDDTHTHEIALRCFMLLYVGVLEKRSILMRNDTPGWSGLDSGLELGLESPRAGHGRDTAL